MGSGWSLCRKKPYPLNDIEGQPINVWAEFDSFEEEDGLLANPTDTEDEEEVVTVFPDSKTGKGKRHHSVTWAKSVKK